MQIIRSVKSKLNELDEEIRKLTISINDNFKLNFPTLEGICSKSKDDNNTLEWIFKELCDRYHYIWIMQRKIETVILATESDKKKHSALLKTLKEIEDIFPKLFEIVVLLREDKEITWRFADYNKMFAYAKEIKGSNLDEYVNSLKKSIETYKFLYNAEYDFELEEFCANFKFSCDLTQYFSMEKLKTEILKNNAKCIIVYQEREGALFYVLARFEESKFAFEIVKIKAAERDILEFNSINDAIKYTKKCNLEMITEALKKLL